MKRYKAHFRVYSATSWDSWDNYLEFEANDIEEAKAKAYAFAKDSGPDFNKGLILPEYAFTGSIYEIKEDE